MLVKQLIPFLLGIAITVFGYELFILEKTNKNFISARLVDVSFRLKSMNYELELLRDELITNEEKVNILEMSTTTTIQNVHTHARNLLEEIKVSSENEFKSERELLYSTLVTSEKLVHDE